MLDGNGEDPMLTDETAAAVARFFEGGKGPSHDELDRLIQRFGLAKADPQSSGSVAGKMKRTRAFLGYVIENEPERGPPLLQALLGLLRAAGCFREASEHFAGTENIEALRAAFRRIGYDLDPAGEVRPTLMENLEGTELTDALWAYVRRARLGAGDATLVIGTAKNLEEAAARHVLKEKTGEYPRHGHFPTTLYQAFAALGLQGSGLQLSKDPYKAMQEALFLLACAVNKLRNEKGEGHGRPEPATATALEGRLSAEAAGLVTELLLTALAGRGPSEGQGESR
jgi:hypothetical protein